jgi:MOSC domain-containing protein YiiM
MESGSIFQINISRGGVPKRPIFEVTVGPRGIVGDVQRDTQHHGRPEQALCLYSVERLAMLREEGHQVSPGATGENITTVDLDWRFVVPGARLRLGAEVTIEITDYAAPCWKNARWFVDGDFSRMDEQQHPGSGRVYARVLTGGTLRQDDLIVPVLETAAERVARTQPRVFRWPQDFR